MADQELSVKISGDASGFERATKSAASALSDLKSDVDKLSSETVDIKIDSNAEDAQRGLDNLKADVDRLDSERVEISAALELDRINRDLATLNRVLDSIERRKATADADMDITQLLRDEDRVRKALDKLDARKIEVEARLDVDNVGIARFQAALDGIDDNIVDLVPGLGRLAGFLRGPAGIAAGLTAVGAAGWVGAAGLGQMAADVETTVVQLKSLLSASMDLDQAAVAADGLYSALEQFAVATPFAVGEAVEAAKKLLAAGLDLEQIEPALSSLGNVAAATGVPLADISTIFQQMYSTGRIANEELLQLSERGVPAYQTLADILGVTVPEVRALASEGKIGVDVIDDLGQALGDLYPQAVADQAESFNGQMSTLRDTAEQIGQNLGRVFLPFMQDVVTILQFVADGALNAAQWLGDLGDRFAEYSKYVPFIGWITGTADAIRNLDEQSADASNVEAWGDGVYGIAEAAVSAEEALKDLAEQYAEIGGEARVRVSFIIDRVSAEREIQEALGDGIELPVRLTRGNLGGLSDDQFGLVEDISAYVEQGLEEGARRAQIDPNFDAEAWYANLRERVGTILIDAGVDEENINQTLNQVFGLPRTAPVVPELTDAQLDVQIKPIAPPGLGPNADLGGILGYNAPITAPVTVTPQNVAPTAAAIDSAAAPRDAPIDVTAPNAGAVGNILDTISKDRATKIVPFIDPSSAFNVARILSQLAQDRYSTIYVRTVRTGGGGGGGGNDDTRSALIRTGRSLAEPFAASADPYFSPAAQEAAMQTSAAGVPTKTVLGPKRERVAVYLDGAEIASHLDLKADRLVAATAGRRA